MTEITKAQQDSLRGLLVDVGESHFPYGLDNVLVFSNRHQPDAEVPYEIHPDGSWSRIGAGYGWGGTRWYSAEHNVHAAIDDIIRQAGRLAPRVAESALDSGNTDTKPTGPVQAKAWDMVAYAHVLNAISDIPVAVQAWGFEA